MASKIQLTKKKLTRLLMLPEVSQVMAIAKRVVNAEAVIAEVVTAEAEIAEVETKVSAMKPEAVIEVIAEIVLSVETVGTVETAEVASAEEVTAEVANAEAENVVSADPKAKVVKIKSAVAEIVPGLLDLPDKKVVISQDRMITEKEEVALAAATEVVSEAAVVEPNLLLPTLAELTSDLLVKASSEAEVASEEASEEAAVASLVREEKVVSTDQKVEINLDAMTASIPEAEVVKEEEVLLVATVEEMPHRLPLEYHREIFENYDL